MPATRLTRKQQAEIETLDKMIKGHYEFAAKYPNDPYMARREQQVQQMERKLAQLTA